ncbi:hypothetical protein C6P40_003172 [Pichia californica]|uniref:Cyclin N-terminal domain-containing protein n=1 Tax=Pichia californica TaxID=460514 RepID=A0A9P6WNF4_9ASCO|nr:hypothetical protein C6P42_004271 [[Candida] californica]KAG0690354.1 hypothetical protein C6P40_003172 [[Candida] californica]
MSDLEALYIFLNKPVNSEMIHYLVATTTSIIYVPNTNNTHINNQNHSEYPTPPSSPTDINENDLVSKNIPSLYSFINQLINHSHVQCTTLMTCLVYLNRLKQVIPSNSVGMATTHHRIFLGSMLLAAKYTNDSSPMNKHWTSYTNGLLSLREVNALEIEMIQYIGWNHLRFENSDLINSLSYFLEPIKRKLRIKNNEKLVNSYTQHQIQQRQIQQQQLQLQQQQQQQLAAHLSHSSTSSSLPSLVSSSSTSTVSSYMSLPRKDSIQSIASSSQPSPIIYSNNHLEAQYTTKQQQQQQPQQQINQKQFKDSITMPLRPLRLKPKSNNSTSNIKNNFSTNNIPLNIPISPSSTSLLSLKNSKKSIRLMNLNSTLNNVEKENIKSTVATAAAVAAVSSSSSSSSSAAAIDNLITIVN